MNSQRSMRSLALLGAVALLASCGGGSGGTPEPPTPPLSFLALFPHEVVIEVGGHVTLKVIARDLSGAEVPAVVPQYSSSAPQVVRVEPDGRIVGLAIGTATVSASAGGQSTQTTVHVGAASYDLATLGPPQVLTANYIDLSKIERISRFRSAIGHSYTDGSETCRSMKHYFQPKLTVNWTGVEIFAPVTGTVWLLASDGGMGFRVMLRPRDLAALQIALFHVNLDPGIVVNSWVQAGERIGTHASSRTMSDIAMSIGPKEGGTLISYFETMTDEVFAHYQARGVASRQAAIITKEERDNDPVPCVGEQQFTEHGTLPNWLNLS